MKIAVYDKKNVDRLLGYLTHYTGTINIGHYLTMPVLEKVFARSYLARSFLDQTYTPTTTITKVEFRVAVKSKTEQRQVDRLTRERVSTDVTVLTTDAPLAELRKVRGFELPQVSSVEDSKPPYFPAYAGYRMSAVEAQLQYEEHRAARERRQRRAESEAILKAFY